MAEENKTANKYFINHRKNTEKNLDRTRDRCPTPGWSSLTILTGIHKDFSEWDPHSPAICSRDELSFLVQNILPKCKANLLLLPITVPASCSDQQGHEPPSQDALTLSSSHQITHKGARSFVTDLQVFLGPLGNFLSCLSADFWTGHLQLTSTVGVRSQGDAHSPSSTMFWHWAVWVRHNFHFMSSEHLRKLQF